METWLAIVLRPFVALLVVGLALLPARLVLQKKLPEGRLKRLLLFRISSAYDTRDRSR
jgi:hypothetical protein